MTRRGFLAGVVAVAAAGCSGSSNRGTDKLPADPFRLGVASGDPLADRVILWTRLAPAPLTAGLAGMPDDKVDVIWQVATDDRFTKVVAKGTATADPANAHAVHVDAGGLEPGSDYFYRFRVGEWTSPVGRTRTTGTPGAVSLGVVTCQAFGTGHYAAYRHLLDEQLDLVVHLGDYIYEKPLSRPGRQVLPDKVPVTLDDFRLRYACYRQDPDLQAAHARYPFMCMWDDHEVANNPCQPPRPPPLNGVDPERKAAAYRAYWEHLPVRLSRPDGPQATLYRDVTFGDLARLYLLDERQYTDEFPCGTHAGDCSERTGHDRTHLGPEQEAWFAEASAAGGVTWNLVGNPTTMAGLNAGSPEQPLYFLENWSGYPAARRRFLDRLGADPVTNPVLLSGDWHAGMVSDVHLDDRNPESPVVAVELMTPALSSPVHGVAGDPNPQVHHVVARNGYLTIRLEPERLTATFRVLDDVARPDSGITTDSTWRIDAGAHRRVSRL